jgi:competence protein ComGC
MKMLGSPMILIAIISVVSMMFLPKILDKSLSPRVKKKGENRADAGHSGSGI